MVTGPDLWVGPQDCGRDRGFVGESPPQGARTLVDLRRFGAGSSTLAPPAMGALSQKS